jgi:hypothetical protein
MSLTKEIQPQMSRLPKAALILGSAILALAFDAWLYLRNALPRPTDKPEISLLDLKRESEPERGEPTPILFAKRNMSCVERLAFLVGDYRILRSVGDLSGGIQKLYTVRGESRIAMADPGESFQATDVVVDSALPWRRLILAGVTPDRALIHYELGGIGRSFVVELYDLKSPQSAVGVWRGYYGPATSLEDLRRLMSEKKDCK